MARSCDDGWPPTRRRLGVLPQDVSSRRQRGPRTSPGCSPGHRRSPRRSRPRLRRRRGARADPAAARGLAIAPGPQGRLPGVEARIGLACALFGEPVVLLLTNPPPTSTKPASKPEGRLLLACMGRRTQRRRRHTPQQPVDCGRPRAVAARWPPAALDRPPRPAQRPDPGEHHAKISFVTPHDELHADPRSRRLIYLGLAVWYLSLPPWRAVDKPCPPGQPDRRP